MFRGYSGIRRFLFALPAELAFALSGNRGVSTRLQNFQSNHVSHSFLQPADRRRRNIIGR